MATKSTKKLNLDGTPAKSAAGRPHSFTEENIRKIEEVAALDGSVEEMASYADVHPATIYRYMQVNEEFRNRIEKLRQRPILKARQEVVKRIGESYANAIDYLKRKRKLEFSERIETDITTKGEALPGADVEELSKKFDEFFKQQNG